MISNLGLDFLTVLLGFGAVAVFGAILLQESLPKTAPKSVRKLEPRPAVPKAQTAPPPVSVSAPKPPAPQPVVVVKPVPVPAKVSIPAIPKPVILSPLEDAVDDQAQVAES